MIRNLDKKGVFWKYLKAKKMEIYKFNKNKTSKIL